MLKKFSIVVLIIILFAAAGCATDTPGRGESAGDDGAGNLEINVIEDTPMSAIDGVLNAEPDKTEIKNAEPEENDTEHFGPEDGGGEEPANNNKTQTTTAKTDGHIFIYKNIEIVLGAALADVLSKLGPERDYYEYPSCAFEGDARIYVYDGFEIATYKLNPEDADRVYSVTFFDDGAATAEGVRIGQSVDDMAAAYGTDCEEIPGSFLYEKGGTILSFTVENNAISVITYYVADIYN